MFNGTQMTMPVAPIAYTTDGGGNNGNGFFGDGAWWIIVLFLFIFCGWGNNGWGNNGNGGGANAPAFQGWATRADIQESFATNNLQSGINAIQQGICSSTYELAGQMSDNFHNQTIATLQGFNGVQSQLADCCCQTQSAIQGVNYNLATNTCALQNTMNNNTRDIIENQNEGTRAILDFLTNDKISSLQTELAQAQGQLSQANQTNNIINALRPCPSPAYVVPNPYAYCNPCGGCGC